MNNINIISSIVFKKYQNAMINTIKEESDYEADSINNYNDLRKKQLEKIKNIENNFTNIKEVNYFLDKADKELIKFDNNQQGSLNQLLQYISNRLNVAQIPSEAGGIMFKENSQLVVPEEKKSEITKALNEIKAIQEKVFKNNLVNSDIDKFAQLLTNNPSIRQDIYWKAKGQLMEKIAKLATDEVLGRASSLVSQIINASGKQLAQDIMVFPKEGNSLITVNVKTSESGKYSKEEKTISEIEKMANDPKYTIKIIDNEEGRNPLEQLSQLNIQVKSGINQNIINKHSLSTQFLKEEHFLKTLIQFYQNKKYSYNEKKNILYPKNKAGEIPNSEVFKQKNQGINYFDVYINFLLTKNQVFSNIFNQNQVYATSHGFSTASQWFNFPENQNKMVGFTSTTFSNIMKLIKTETTKWGIKRYKT